jgi:hypothetical protein
MRYDPLFLCRDTRANVYDGIPHCRTQNEWFLTNNTPWGEIYCRDPKGKSLIETASTDVLYVGLASSGLAVCLPNKTSENITLPVDNFNQMGSRHPQVYR